MQCCVCKSKVGSVSSAKMGDESRVSDEAWNDWRNGYGYGSGPDPPYLDSVYHARLGFGKDSEATPYFFQPFDFQVG